MTSKAPANILELPCVLSHPAVAGSLGTVARLLCTSSSTAAAVSQYAAGKLQRLNVSLDLWIHPLLGARCKAAWLRKHKGLIQGVQSLHFDCSYYPVTPAIALEVERLLLDALSEAGPLRSLISFKGNISGAPVTLGFAPSTLQSVYLGAWYAKEHGTWSSDTAQSIAKGLAAMTGLQSLNLECCPELEACLPVPSVMPSCWPQLTCVLLRSSDRITPGLMEKLGHLPQSLQKLTLMHEPATFSEDFGYTVDFLRLTNLTELCLSMDGSNTSFAAASHLPTSLQALDFIAPSVSTALFMGLSQLRSLTIYQNLMPMPAVLHEMRRSLKQLTHVGLGAKKLPWRPPEDEDIAASIIGYPEIKDLVEPLAALPLRKLHLMHPGRLTFFVPELHRLTQLTALTLSDISPGLCYHGFDIVEQQLKELIALEQLELEGPLHGLLDDMEPEGLLDGPPQPQSFVQTIAGLPNLQSLSLRGMKLGRAAMELQASTRLAYVDLGGGGYNPAVVKALRDMYRRNSANGGSKVV